jgi:HAE1 family hydrophobic/amphiphilic exporter-1
MPFCWLNIALVSIKLGVPRNKALVKAGEARLRPILMTTVAMVAGMVPIALGIGAGSEVRASMAAAVIGGLITSTLLTLSGCAGGVYLH